MTYIVHLNLGRARGIRYGTIREPDLTVRYQQRTRVKSTRNTPIGPISELEQIGWDKSRVGLHFSSDTIVDDRGTKGLYPGNAWFRLLERHKHIRRLTELDETAIAAIDREIEDLIAKLNAVRKRRREVVEEAWRHATKIGIDELEERAGAHLERSDRS